MGKGRMGRAVRRGVALGMALVALWGVWLTAGGCVEERLTELGERPGLAVALLSRALRAPAPREEALRGWGRLLVDHCPLLAAGEAEVLALRSARQGESGSGGDSLDPIDGEDEEQPDLQPPDQTEGVIEMTGQGKEGGNYISDGNVYLYNRTKLTLDASLFQAGTVDVTMGEGPQILIVHTHGSESYSMTDGELYEESDPYRTTDCTHNVVKVGEEMATVLRAHGFQVIHDPTLFDYPSYNGAYNRSQAAVEQWLAQYPTIQVVLDVHRDALVGSEGQVYKMVSREAGEKVAQVMMVLGTDGGGAEHPRWRDNLAFALLLQRNLVRGYTSLVRPTVLRNSRYNQQLLPGSILVEVGGHGNTLSEAVAGARLWADNVARTLLTLRTE